MKAYLVAMFVLLAGGGARSEPGDCEALKSSYEPFQVIRVIRTDGGLDADHTAVYRHFRDIGEFMTELKDLLNAKE